MLVEELMQEFGGEVVAQTPLSMGWDEGRASQAESQTARCTSCSRCEGYRVIPDLSTMPKDVAVVANDWDKQAAVFSELMYRSGLDFTPIPTLACNDGREVAPAQLRMCSTNVQASLRASGASLVLAVNQDAVTSLGFTGRIEHLDGRVAIWWADETTRRGCFVLFVHVPSEHLTPHEKTKVLSRIYLADRIVRGEQSAWDLIGAGGCVSDGAQLWPEDGPVGCPNPVNWLDENGMPFCKGHKTLKVKLKTKARRKEARR